MAETVDGGGSIDDWAGCERLTASYPALVERRVVITGAASGIGACLLQAFLDQGAAVVAIDRAADALHACKTRFAGRNVQLVEADLGSAGAASRVVASVAEAGPIDVFIANAGNDTRHAWDVVTEQSWRETLWINLDHQFFGAQAAARSMVAHKRAGCILLLGSVAARRGRPAMAGYLSSKAAIEGLVRGLARELGHAGVRVAGIVPGAIDTERQRRLWRTPDSVRYVLAEQALPLQLDGWDVAAMALFLASDQARGCTGQMYVVDAGLS